MQQIRIHKCYDFREGDYWKAWVADQPGWWARGKTATEAIGELIRTCPQVFNIALVYDSLTNP